LSSAEDHTAGRYLLLRGAGRGKMLTATQRCRKSVRRDWGHSVGDWYTGLLQLKRVNITVNIKPHTHTHNASKSLKTLQTHPFMQVHDHGSLLLLNCMMLLMMMMGVVVSGRVQ